MGRGIDFKGVNLVINYDFPPSITSYIHRIGRTGRAGKKGKAITFWSLEDRPLLRRLVQAFKHTFVVKWCDILPSVLRVSNDKAIYKHPKPPLESKGTITQLELL